VQVTMSQTPLEGMFRALGRRFYRSMAFAMNIQRDMLGSVDPKMQVPILKNLTANIGLGMKSLYVGSQFCLPGPLLTSFSIRSDWKVHPSARPVSGVVFVSTPFVIIRWSWLSYLLLVELVLSSLFLFCIITWTTLTKSEALSVSTLATLCALDEPTR